MAISKREEGKKVNSNINVTPMVDVMLVLLIIFMVITPMLNNKVNVDLPKVSAATVMENANKEDAIVVAVTRDGKTFLGGDQVSLDAIWARAWRRLLAKKTDAGRRQDGVSACRQSRQLRQGDGHDRRGAHGGREPAWPADREERRQQ